MPRANRRGPARDIFRARQFHQRHRRPQHRAEDQHRQPEVRGQAELRHARVVDEAALHHVPAERALQRAQHEDRGQRLRVPRGNAPAREKIEEGQQEHGTDQPPQQPVEIFPPEDALELGERHRVIDLAKLGRRLVLAERGLPVAGRQRRHRADDRLPFGDRQPGMREPRDAADDDDQEHQRATGDKPQRDRAGIARLGDGRRRGAESARGGVHRARFYRVACTAFSASRISRRRYNCACGDETCWLWAW